MAELPKLSIFCFSQGLAQMQEKLFLDAYECSVRMLELPCAKK